MHISLVEEVAGRIHYTISVVTVEPIDDDEPVTSTSDIIDSLAEMTRFLPSVTTYTFTNLLSSELLNADCGSKETLEKLVVVLKAGSTMDESVSDATDS